jgi:hypothetical protein
MVADDRQDAGIYLNSNARKALGPCPTIAISVELRADVTQWTVVTDCRYIAPRRNV